MESGKVILDFQVIESKDPKILIVADSSMWKHIKDKPAIIEILIPGRHVPMVHYFQKESFNIFNSLTLSVNCISGCEGVEYVDLPDGIYTITIKGSPQNLFCKERKYLRDTELKLEISKIFFQLTNVKEVNKQKLKMLREAEMLLKGASGAIAFNNVKESINNYTKAEELIDQIKNCKDCGNSKHHS